MRTDAEMAAAARALLEAGGCKSILIDGAGDDWRVGCSFEPPQDGKPVIHVMAYSARCKTTPNDPVYLAGQALAALIRNERPRRRKRVPENSAFSQEPDFGAEMLAFEEEAGEDSGDEQHDHPDNRRPAADDGGTGEPPTQALEGVGAGDGEQLSDGRTDDSRGAELPLQAAPTESGGMAGAAGYSGLVLLEDDLGRRRNQVLAAITARRVLLEDVAADPSRRDFLRTEFVRYQNAGALGLPLDETLTANYAAFLALQSRDAAITDQARQIERAALEADLNGLERIAQGLDEALR